jgi:2-haloacid dehalogenase
VTNAALRERLMNSYLSIMAFRDVRPALDDLKSAGMKLAILSNGTPHMLAAAVANSQLTGHFDAVLSVEEVGVFKPHPSVYRLAPQRLALRAEEIC